MCRQDSDEVLDGEVDRCLLAAAVDPDQDAIP